MVQGLENVAVIGAGIGGLASAIALSRRGANVRIFERSSCLLEAGAGIWIPPNGMRVLASLGIADEVKRAGMEIASAEVLDSRAGRLQTTETISSDGWTNIAIHRQTLQQILKKHVAEGTIEFGHELVGLVEEQNHVSLRFTNSVGHHADIVLAADGIHSATRRCLFPGLQLRYSGQTSWRAVTGFSLPPHAAREGVEIWSPGVRFGYSLIAASQVYWYATADAPPGQTEPPEQARNRFIAMARSFKSPIPEMVEATPSAAILRTDLWDLPALSNWGRGPVILLGDAAHAATPNVGQGGAQALEDAWTLANVLADAPDVQHALSAFELQRMKRAQQVGKMSWQVGKLAHMGGLGRSIRNVFIRAMPRKIARRQADALYGQ
jgi:2-polyprenyl-6-methoxyphenol hydroxylase-like FAD-dependent oxidoreductase